MPDTNQEQLFSFLIHEPSRAWPDNPGSVARIIRPGVYYSSPARSCAVATPWASRDEARFQGRQGILSVRSNANFPGRTALVDSDEAINARRVGGRAGDSFRPIRRLSQAHGFVEARASLACSGGDGKRSTLHRPGAVVHVGTDLPWERLSPVVPAPDRTKQSTNGV